MEYEWEENDVVGDVPEFGAIFMSNIATKRECFKRKVFALPSSMASFVKQVKEGMVLFLFEFEKRQLFGVYRATSDGAMNIAPHAINSSGKRFPAQVRFTPIWICKPLFENEFREAIRENYFSAKKFHFGLSKEQVRHLLHLFSTRKLVNDMLAPRQMTSAVTGSVSKDGRQGVDRGFFARRERLEMEHFENNVTSADMNELLEYAPHRVFEVDENVHFADDRLENGKTMDTFGLNSWTDQAGDFLHVRTRACDNEAESELYDTRTSLLPFETDNQGVFLDKERIQAAHNRSLMAENTVNDCNIYSSLSPAAATSYTGGTFDLTRRAVYERSLFEGTNVHGNDDMFLMNDNIEKNVNLRGSFRPVMSNENEQDVKRPRRAVGDHRFFIHGSESDQKYLMNDDINPVHPSENVDNSLHRAKGPSSNRKLLMGERLASERDLDNGLRLDFLSRKLRDPFDSDQRKFDQRRFLQRDKVTKANYRDGVHGSANLYVPSGFDRSKGHVARDALLTEQRLNNRHDIETFLRPVSSKYTAFPHPKQDLSECFSKPSQDTHFSQVEGQKHFRNLNSTFHDSVVTRTVPSSPEPPIFHHRHSLSNVVDRGASIAVDNPHYGSGGDSLALSNSKMYDREGFGRYDHTSDFGDENPYSTNCVSHFHAGQGSQSMELISSAPADVRDLVSTVTSPPLAESFDLYSYKKSPLASNTCSMLSQEKQKHIYLQENDERIAGNIVPSSKLNLAGLDAYHQQRYLDNDAVDRFKSYKTDIAIDGGQHCLIPGGGYSDFDKQRRSVFTRLRLTPRVFAQEEREKVADFYRDKSVDELMDILNATQNFRNKNLRKFRPVVKQPDRDELPRIEKRTSPELVQPRFATTKVDEKLGVAVKEGVDELPKETRAVEFKRRSELKKDLDENSTKINVHSAQDSTSRDIHENKLRENAEPEGQVNKPQKRRKLVRPVF